MSAKLLTAPEREGSTFGLAIRLLGVLAVGTIVLCCWAILIRFDGKERAGAAESWSRFAPSFAEGAQPATAVTPEATAMNLAPLPLPLPLPVPAPVSAGSGDVVSGALAPLPTVTALPPLIPPGPLNLGAMPEHPAHQVPNNVARELVTKALQMREQGDTQGCLQALKEAGELQKDHPKILAELATTYSQIGQEAKSAAYWETVHKMGPQNAGTYWDLADMALKGELLDESTPVNDYLRVSRHLVRSVSGEAGKAQEMVLRIQVEAVTKEPVDYRRMYLQVYFYDMVNEARFEQTIADTRPNYISAPYDWRNGEEEIIEVEYHLPELSPEQVAQLGRRQYYGYLIELYYNDVLQDLVAAPRKLARFGSANSPAAENEP